MNSGPGNIVANNLANFNNLDNATTQYNNVWRALNLTTLRTYFVNPDSGDWHLINVTGSPYIGTGVTIATLIAPNPNVDYDGNPRIAPYDLGAFTLNRGFGASQTSTPTGSRIIAITGSSSSSEDTNSSPNPTSGQQTGSASVTKSFLTSILF